MREFLQSLLADEVLIAEVRKNKRNMFYVRLRDSDDHTVAILSGAWDNREEAEERRKRIAKCSIREE